MYYSRCMTWRYQQKTINFTLDIAMEDMMPLIIFHHKSIYKNERNHTH
jgi:hypothetical protein